MVYFGRVDKEEELSIVRILQSVFFVFLLSMVFSQVTFAEENNISSGLPVQGKISSSNDKDIYRFTMDKDGEARIILDNTTSGFYAYLYDSNGKEVTSTYTSTAGLNIGFLEYLKKGTYSVELQPYHWSANGDTSGSYRLKATYAASTVKRDAKTFEPNDTLETSMQIKSGKMYTSDISSTDRDVYQFTTKKDGEAYITFDNLTEAFYVTLFDSNRKEVTSAYTSSAGGEISLLTDIQKGTYYIVVNDYCEECQTTSASYRLKATFASTFTRDAKTFETNDTIETSMPIISNKYYNSSSFSSLDRDVYKFTTKKDGEARITLDNTKAGFYAYLYDSNGTEVARTYTARAGKKITFSPRVKKGTYYIVINPYGWGGSGITSATYRLKATYKNRATAPSVPTINKLKSKSLKVTGKGTKGTTIYVYNSVKKIGRGSVSSKGNYSVKIKAQKKGTVVRVYAKDKYGNKSKSRTIRVK